MSIWGRRVDAWADEVLSGERGGRGRDVVLAVVAGLLAGGAVLGVFSYSGSAGAVSDGEVLYRAIGAFVLVAVAVHAVLSARARRRP